MSAARAVFIEFPEQIPAFEAELGTFADARVIALTPHASLELEWRGIPHSILPDYFDEKAIEDFGHVTTANVNRLVALIDGHLHEHVEAFKAADFRPTWISAYNLKKLYDSVALRLYELSHFIEATRVRELVYATPEQRPFGDNLYWGELSLYSQILRVISGDGDVSGREVEFDFGTVRSTLATTYLPAEAQSLVEAPLNPRTRGVGARVGVMAARLVNRANYRRLSIFGRRSGGAPSARPVIIDLQATLPVEHWAGYARVWSWQDAKGEPIAATGQRARVSCPSRSELGEELAAAWQSIQDDPAFFPLLRFGDWDWSPLAKGRIRFLCGELAERLWHERNHSVAVLTAVCPDIVLLRNPNSLSVKVALAVARQLGIRVVGTQHGEYGFRDNSTLQYQDYAFLDDFLVAGEGVREFCDRRYPGAIRVTVTGSPDLDAVRNKRMPRSDVYSLFGLDMAAPMIVLCFTALEGNSRALRNTLPSDCTTFRKLRKIVDVCLAHPELQFLIKGYPGTKVPVSSFYAYLERHRASNVKIHSVLPFPALLDAATTVILNCPGTTLLQASMTEAAIYIFEDWFRWEPEALETISSRCVIDDDLDRFCSRLHADLSSGKAFERAPQHCRLRELYADPFGDGRSVERVRDAVLAAPGKSRWEPRLLAHNSDRHRRDVHTAWSAPSGQSP